MYVCVTECVCVCEYGYMCECVYVYMCIYVYVCVCEYMYVCVLYPDTQRNTCLRSSEIQIKVLEVASKNSCS